MIDRQTSQRGTLGHPQVRTKARSLLQEPRAVRSLSLKPSLEVSFLPSSELSGVPESLVGSSADRSLGQEAVVIFRGGQESLNQIQPARAAVHCIHPEIKSTLVRCSPEHTNIDHRHIHFVKARLLVLG